MFQPALALSHKNRDASNNSFVTGNVQQLIRKNVCPCFSLTCSWVFFYSTVSILSLCIIGWFVGLYFFAKYQFAKENG
ncbi:hypothetical protein WR25_00822 [Diploscapter pachys]|uniref:Uncharacterized protein n=1 Tax=Diploscapter pachys TaxID=2018661 RepID=A0A2A2JV88_9BILA|nr:hypothetical protein WR25_00822 [Diploscapter pachys]